MAAFDTVAGEGNEVAITWDDDMDQNANFLDPTNYDVNGRHVVSVVANGTNGAILTVYPELAKVTYTLTVNTLIIDVNGDANIIRDFDFDVSAVHPEIASAVMPEAGRVRVTFTEGMAKDANLENPAKYSVTPVTAGAALVSVTEVVVNNAINPTFVDLLVTDAKHGATYSVSASDLSDAVGNPLEISGPTNFTAVGSKPTVKQVKALSVTTVEVEFSEPMADNADLRNPAKYTWTGGLSTLAIVSVDAEKVVLSTSEQTPDTIYTLTVAS